MQSPNNNKPHPFSAGGGSLPSNSKGLGSQCPVILKHEFPNESKEYLDDVFQEMSSTQKRFRYNRPMTAKTTFNSNKRGSFSSQPTHSQHQQRPQTAAAGASTLENLTSAELYKKLLQNKGGANEKRFQIQPQKKLNTYQIHSALYKVKKQKEYLDQKIQELEERKTNFNQTDFYLIANSGAMEYIFNMQNSQSQMPMEQMSQAMQGSSQNNIKEKLETSVKERKSSLPRDARPLTGKAKKKKPDYLRPDTEWGDNEEFTIIGNVTKQFKYKERMDVVNWGEEIDFSGSISQQGMQKSAQGQSQQIKSEMKEKIDNITQNYSNLQYLMSSVKQQEEEEAMEDGTEEIEKQRQQQLLLQQQQLQFKDKIGQIQEEDEDPQTIAQKLKDYDQKQMELEQQHLLQQQNLIKQVQHNYITTENRPGSSHASKELLIQSQYGAGPASESVGLAGLSKRNATNSNNYSSMNMNNTFTSGFRPNSAGGIAPGRPISSKLQVRPQTAKNAPLHALMSYGDQQKVKQSIKRNFDHLELLRRQKEVKWKKQLNVNQLKSFRKQQQSLSVVGQGLEALGEQFQMQRFGTLTSQNFMSQQQQESNRRPYPQSAKNSYRPMSGHSYFNTINGPFMNSNKNINNNNNNQLQINQQNSNQFRPQQVQIA